MLRRALPEARILVMGPTERGRRRARGAARADRRPRRRDPGRRPRPSQARLRDGTLGTRRAAAAARERRRAHDASRDRRRRLRASQRSSSTRFRAATEPYAHLTRHAANSAAALRIPEARFDAARCGIALYGISPFNTDPGGGRAPPGARMAQPSRAGAPPPARREHRLRPPLRRSTNRPGSASSRSATPTASGAT